MKCDQFERILEEQDDAALPQPALAHLETCESCRFLAADFGAIRDLALELSAEEIPVPERVWIAVRNQIDAERVVQVDAERVVQIDAERMLQGERPAVPSVRPGWWTAFQRPALAAAFLSLIVAAAAMIGYQSGSVQSAVRVPIVPPQESAPVFSAENAFRAESLTVGDALIPELQQQDAAVTDSFRRNLSVVDHFISICETSVREQPENEMAREYLYGAYEQKAELLATAMNRSVTGGLQ